MEDKQDVLARTYATLSAIRKNIGEMKEYSILETYVQEFHSALDRIESIGIDISEFRIPDLEIVPRVTSIPTLTGKGYAKTTYSKGKYVIKSFILTKLDAILSYFEITMSEKPRNIGLRPQDK